MHAPAFLRNLHARRVRRSVTTHLFVLSPNNSGSTFVNKAFAGSRAVWSLTTEGQAVPGFAGPRPQHTGRALIWAGHPEWVDEYLASPAFDWEANRTTWYGFARAGSRGASVFVEKSPPFLLVPDTLRAHFPGTRFVVMVRHPLAVVEGIVRNRRNPAPPGPDGHRADLRIVAADHVATCLRLQAENARRLGSDAVVTTYEQICADPTAFNRAVRALVPALEDFDVDVELAVKGQYRERLRDMNADQIARLDPEDRRVVEDRLAPHADVLAEWGYSL